MSFNVNQYKRLMVVAGFVVIFDQITKALILYNLPLHHSLSVIPGFFSLTHIHNPGGAFGFLANQSSGLLNIFFLFISLLSILLLIYFYKNIPPTYPWLVTSLALILGGAIGNLIDRIRFGAVIDFLDCYVGTLHWPAFNVADSAISVGVTIILFYFLFKKLPA